ncbi:hypothetical protein [Glutamicibacter sp. NPDC087344]
MKKFMKQFEGLQLTSRGQWVSVILVGLVFWGSLWGAYEVGGVA